jgi:transmembrane sensor
MDRDAIHTEAARWFTRLQAAELPLEETLEWQRWMALDPRHAEAFGRLEEVWHGFSVLPRPALLPRDALAQDDYDGSVPVREWTVQKKRSRWRHRPFLLSLAACAAIVVVGAVALLTHGTAGEDILTTEVGENRTVTLADGSRVSLGGQTRVEVKLRARQRDLTLSWGEALFVVAKDATRPFVVRAGSATVTAVGTQFNVQRTEDRVVVSVLEGQVKVQPMLAVLPILGLENFSPVIVHGQVKALDAGHRASVDRSGMGATVNLPDVSVATAWDRGRLAFDDEPLKYVVEVVNRYSRRPIVIEDSGIAELRVSGTVVEDHIDGWVASLDTAFGIRAEEDGATIRLRR